MNIDPMKLFSHYVNDVASEASQKLEKVKIVQPKSLEEIKELRDQLRASIEQAESMGSLSIKDQAILAEGRNKLAMLEKHIQRQERFKRWGL